MFRVYGHCAYRKAAGHVNPTTPTPNQPDTTEPASPAEDPSWSQRYTGLQKVVAKRDEALHTAGAAFDALQAERDADLIELNAYRQADVDKSEEETALATYESLKERFSHVRPHGNNPARTQGGAGDWTNPAKREVGPERSPGFPT
jgi:hypothetical protein